MIKPMLLGGLGDGACGEWDIGWAGKDGYLVFAYFHLCPSMGYCSLVIAFFPMETHLYYY